MAGRVAAVRGDRLTGAAGSVRIGGPAPLPPRAPRWVSRYRRRMPELIAPTVRLHAPWLEAHDEWGPGVHEDGFGLLPSDEVDSPSGFAAWVARLTAESESAKAQDAGRVPRTYRWIVNSERVLGGDRPAA